MKDEIMRKLYRGKARNKKGITSNDVGEFIMVLFGVLVFLLLYIAIGG